MAWCIVTHGFGFDGGCHPSSTGASYSLTISRSTQRASSTCSTGYGYGYAYGSAYAAGVEHLLDSLQLGGDGGTRICICICAAAICICTCSTVCSSAGTGAALNTTRNPRALAPLATLIITCGPMHTRHADRRAYTRMHAHVCTWSRADPSPVAPRSAHASAGPHPRAKSATSRANRTPPAPLPVRESVR